MKDAGYAIVLGGLVTQLGNLVSSRFRHRKSEIEKLLERYSAELEQVKKDVCRLSTEVDTWKEKYFTLLERCIGVKGKSEDHVQTTVEVSVGG
jgi:predicted  nucleic acid-binding Zn-ribbon protein